MTQIANSPVSLGRALATTSRPQNIVFSGLLSILISTHDGSFWRGIWCYILLWLLYAIAATYNNLHDITTDRANKRTDNPFSNGQLSRSVGTVWLTIALIGVLLLQFIGTQPVSFWCVIAYLCLLGAYSHPQLRLQARGLIAPIVLSICYTAIPITLASGQYGSIDWWLAGLMSLLSIPLLLAKDYKDLAGDRATGKKTPLIRYGARRLRYLSLGIALAGCCLVVGYALALAASGDSIVIGGALSLVVYLYSVWHVHHTQLGRHSHFLRLPQLALLALTFCLLQLT